METTCQINFNLLNTEEIKRAKEVVLEYLLSHADKVELTVSHAHAISVELIPFHARPKLEAELDKDDVIHKSKEMWVIKVSDKVKELFRKTGIFFKGSKPFHGFDDAKFIKNEKELAYMFSDEKILTLHIPDSDKAELGKQGVYTDSPEL